MRRGTLVTLMLVGVGTVLAISLWSLQRGRRSIFRDFEAAQSSAARGAASDLLASANAFDSDTRLAASIAQRTRGQTAIGPAAQDQVIRAAFESQVTVVAHYRSLALFGGGRAAPIVAVDPTEDRARIAPALIAASGPVAREAAARGRTTVLGPIALGDNRSFYFYAAPAGPGEAVVASADARLMLQGLRRGSGDRETMLIVDPSNVIWVCAPRTSCQPIYPGTDPHRRIGELLRAPPLNDRPHAAEVDPSLQLPSRIVIGAAPPADSPLGRWSVYLIASAAEIDARERTLLWQLLLTSAGVIVTMLTVGFFIVRQRAAAAALETRLLDAQEIATLRERSERILENVPTGILGVTREGRLATVNRFFLERFGPARDGGPHPEGLDAWTQRLKPHIDRALASKRIQVLSDRDDAGPRDLRDYAVRIVPLDRPADDVEALVLVEDLAEIHGLQRQLVRAEKLVTVGVLSAGIAHEVGTPLAVIRARSEHLLESAAPGPAAEALRAIVGQIDRISSTIRQVLEFSRVEPIQAGVADPRTSVARAVGLLEWRLANKKIIVRQQLDGAPPIAADPLQFEQLIVNLLMNACDASPEGATIEVVARIDEQHPDRLRLDLVDHGTGIAPEHVNAVFDPYFTTKKRDEGTGLGLAVVARIARLHKAEISLSSVPGMGTTATVVWPIAPQEVALA